LEWPEFIGRYAAEIDEVVQAHEQSRLRVGYRTIRDLHYLDWRYGSHPDVRYGVHALAGDSGRLDGFLVARSARGARGLTALVLTEVFVREPSTRSLRRLLRSAMRASGGDYWMAHARKGTLEHAALRRSGFVHAPGRGYTWTALPLRDDIPDPTRPDAWDLTLGEMEIF
ncbi:MAG TPA: hypothetical protein VFU06_09230, partial [Longimicrobiales bacterium]|nr:hypothetical protein [Longimicrobiales bacterium]